MTAYHVTPLLGGVAQPSTVFNERATSEVVTGLTNGSTYMFKVAALNVNGLGTASAAGGTTTIGAPGIPTAVRPRPETRRPSSSGRHREQRPDDHRLYRDALRGLCRRGLLFVSTATTQTITGLTAGTAISFRVAAVNSRGTGPNSSASNVVTVT